MSERVWYRSLYWRIAFGFVALLAVLLLTQTVLFLWLTGRLDESPQGRTAQQTADYVARELSDALAVDASLDLDRFVRERVENVNRPFVIVMRDGRRASNQPDALPPGFMDGRGRGGRGGPRPPAVPAAPGAEGAPDGRSSRTVDARPRSAGRPRPPFAPVVVNGEQVGTVGVPPAPPTWVVVRQYGPTLIWVGLALLVAGAVTASLLIFGPTHKRLRSLEAAARALREGRSDARATEAGGDEVAALSHEFNRMADDLQERAAALSASDTARRQLLADVSHELMTPLTAIRGYTETLTMTGLELDDRTRRRYLEVVNQETYKLEAIIGDLLDVARLEGGGETFDCRPVSVEELFRRVLERHDPAIRQKRIQVTVDIAPEAAEVNGDANRLEQALQNLAANAIRHIPNGGSLTLRAEADATTVRLTVQDSGPGIPLEHLPHIFDRFYKGDAARTGTAVASGSGLGLSIVRAIVARHGGEVRASNAGEGGAVFEVVLPTGVQENQNKRPRDQER